MWLLAFILLSIIGIGVIKAYDTSIDNLDVVYPDNPNPEFTTKCFEGLGCFYTGPPFYHPIYRPFTTTPADNTSTRYYLYTPSNPNDAYQLMPNKESLKKSPFDDKLPVKVLIHGYETPDGDFQAFSEIKNELLKLDDFNVILVNWAHDNGPPAPQAYANCRLTGAKVAQLLNFIMCETDLKAEDIHVIGHSFGGEMCGFIGERIKNMGRITSLDPGGPFYHHSPPEVHVDRSDALFVEVIHTNGGQDVFGGIGLIEAVGHADFFPNGGNLQPGCDKMQFINLTVPEGQPIGNRCSHRRALMFCRDSINNCKYTAYAATSYSAFKDGQYKGENRMGYHATKPDIPLMYYLDTKDEAPFCEIDPDNDEGN